ncbi:hypothetical protein [Devosia sp. Root635]|uniref:hypothetical protein n=1 Tax=Devosia sp. Root635 TaxID=1736575 RepID=UPI0006F4C4B2|nr:hypothetical protein [Devosia sp. Root635]KRA42062.1 hypothetical protein ASD80_10065 [Devosia sp. Root635]
MSYVFSLLGWVTIIAGGAWVGLTVRAMRSIDQTAPYSGAASLGAVMAVAPGFGLMFSGLLLLAIGAVVYRLARIDRNTADTADLLERLIPKKPQA